MAELTLYYNPRCSKCRKTLALLQQHGVQPRIVEYLETPPSAEQIAHILDLLELEPRGLLRSGEAEYLALGLDDPALSREQLIQAMVDHPRLMERPIVIGPERAVIARPPERALEILP